MHETAGDALVGFLNRLEGRIDQLIEEQQDQARRLTLLEVALSNLAASEMGHYANVSLRASRMETRLDRIEGRLGLIEV